MSKRFKLLSGPLPEDTTVQARQRTFPLSTGPREKRKIYILPGSLLDIVQSRARWSTPAKVFERSLFRRGKGLDGKSSSDSCEPCPQAGKEEESRVAGLRPKPVQAFS